MTNAIRMIQDIPTEAYFFCVLGLFSLIIGARFRQSKSDSKRRRSDRVIGSVIFGFGLLVIAGSVLGGYISARTREDFRNRILEITADEFSVLVDGRPSPEKSSIANELLRVTFDWEHKSHATNEYEVILRNADNSLRIELWEDSRKADELWVYARSGSHRQRIGSVYSDALVQLIQPPIE